MTNAMSQQISEQLRQLARFVRAPLMGETKLAGAVDLGLADFASRRHRVGPLLYAAQQTAGLEIEAAASQMLARQYRMNALRVAITKAFFKDLASRFLVAEIPWLAFKGVPLAQQLYPDPAWRHCHDVDVLVPAPMHAKAREILKEIGFSIANTHLHPDHWLERAAAALAKDVMFRQPKSGIHVELHRRLFFARAEELYAPILFEIFQPRLGLSEADVPSAPLGAGATFYLLLHGASSRWFRLKWLVDLIPLTRDIDAAQVDAIADAAKHMQAETTVKAGLQLLGWVFGDIANGPVQAWLGESAGKTLVDARSQIYLNALDRPHASQANQEGDRFDSLDMYYSMIDSSGYRMAVAFRGGAWVALRTLTNRLARRTGKRTPAGGWGQTG